MDICPNNLLIKGNSIKLADFSSWCDAGSLVDSVTSTPPYFTSDLVGERITPIVDYVMLLRTISWVRTGRSDQFHEACVEGKHVGTVVDLKNLINTIFAET